MDSILLEPEGAGDRDSDGVMDPDDNCPDDWNPNQEDVDLDPAGDVCDCDAVDWTVWLLPLEVPFLHAQYEPVTSMILIGADLPPPGAQIEVYDVIRARRADGFADQDAVCLGTDLPVIVDIPDQDDPGPGEIFFYLARGENDCPGSYDALGHGSDGIPRVGIDCVRGPDIHHSIYGQSIPVISVVPYPDADGDGIPDAIYGCLNCHGPSFTVERNCAVCH